MAEQKSKSGGARKIGRNKDRCKLYASRLRRHANKQKRILQSSGVKAARDHRRGPAHSIRYTRRHGNEGSYQTR